MPPGWFAVLPLPCRVPGWSLLEGGCVWGLGEQDPPRPGSGMFCGAYVPCVWCVTPWALGLPAGCPRVPSAGSQDPNCGFGVVLPWPPSFGSVATLVPPSPPSWGPRRRLQRGFASPPACYWCLAPHPAPRTPFPAQGPSVQAGGSFWVGFVGNAGEAPAQGPSGGGSRGFNWFHLG